MNLKVTGLHLEVTPAIREFVKPSWNASPAMSIT